MTVNTGAQSPTILDELRERSQRLDQGLARDFAIDTVRATGGRYDPLAVHDPYRQQIERALDPQILEWASQGESDERVTLQDVAYARREVARTWSAMVGAQLRVMVSEPVAYQFMHDYRVAQLPAMDQVDYALNARRDRDLQVARAVPVRSASEVAEPMPAQPDSEAQQRLARMMNMSSVKSAATGPGRLGPDLV